MNAMPPISTAASSSCGCHAQGAGAITIVATTDLAPVLALRHQLLRQGYLSSYGVVSSSDTEESAIHLLAFLGETPIGTCSFIMAPCPQREGRAAEIIGMAVMEDHRRSGIGTGLLQHGLARLPADSSWVWAKARCTALGFYVRHGFRPVSKVYDILPGVPHRTVMRSIEPSSRRQQGG